MCHRYFRVLLVLKHLERFRINFRILMLITVFYEKQLVIKKKCLYVCVHMLKVTMQ